MGCALDEIIEIPRGIEIVEQNSFNVAGDRSQSAFNTVDQRKPDRDF